MKNRYSLEMFFRDWWCRLRRHELKRFERLDGEVVYLCERCVLEFRTR